jgi:AcrR family transcriptional regulator
MPGPTRDEPRDRDYERDRDGDRDLDEARLADGREVLRQVRLAGREAVREARRSAHREAREHIVDTVRQAREQALGQALQAREQIRDARHGRIRGEEAGTRTRIQQVALRLFTEMGYEATSLREIAEELGVTKAALYYHFRTKDEIIESLLDDRLRQVGELIDWGRTQPATTATRRELLRRYSALLYQTEHHLLMRFAERNQSSMGKHPLGAKVRDQMLELHALLFDPGAPLTRQVRSSLALFALHSVWFTVRDPAVSDAERSAAALTVALELVEGDG